MNLTRNLAFAAALLLLGCSAQKSENMTEDGLMLIDVAKEDYIQKRVNLADIADVEYVKLETADSSLIGNNFNVAYDGNNIVVADISSKKFLIFDKTGKFINSVNRKGRGSEEYQNISRSYVDFNSKTIYVYEPAPESVIKAYDFEGNFKNKYELPIKLTSSSNLAVIENKFVTRTDVGVSTFGTPPTGLTGSMPKEVVDPQPFKLISIDDAKTITPLNINVDKNEPNTAIVMSESSIAVVKFKPYDMFKTGDEVIISDFAKDTIYSYSKGGLKPIAIRNNVYLSENIVRMSSVAALSDNYMFLVKEDKNLNMTVDDKGDSNDKIFMFDRESGEISLVNIFLSASSEAEINLYNWQKNILPKNMVVVPMDALSVIVASEEGTIDSKLGEVAQDLTEEDNPVLAFVKF